MNAPELKKALLRVIGVDQSSSASDADIQSIVVAINHAYQVLWQDVPRERRTPYTRRQETVTLGAGVNRHQFDGDVQAVLAGVRRLPENTPLLAARHLSEVENYGLYRGRLSGDVTNAPPTIYYIEAIHQAQADAVRVSLIVAPTPTVDTDLKVEVELEAPNITATDLCILTPAALKIANQYVESLLLPIAAYHLATQSSKFSRARGAEALAPIKEEYERTKARLGIVDPSTNAARAGVTPSDR